MSPSNTNLIPIVLSIKNIFVYLSVNRGGRCHLDIEHSFVIIHPLHAWELNLPQNDIQLI